MLLLTIETNKPPRGGRGEKEQGRNDSASTGEIGRFDFALLAHFKANFAREAVPTGLCRGSPRA